MSAPPEASAIPRVFAPSFELRLPSPNIIPLLTDVTFATTVRVQSPQSSSVPMPLPQPFPVCLSANPPCETTYVPSMAASVAKEPCSVVSPSNFHQTYGINPFSSVAPLPTDAPRAPPAKSVSAASIGKIDPVFIFDSPFISSRSYFTPSCAFAPSLNGGMVHPPQDRFRVLLHAESAKACTCVRNGRETAAALWHAHSMNRHRPRPSVPRRYLR